MRQNALKTTINVGICNFSPKSCMQHNNIMFFGNINKSKDFMKLPASNNNTINLLIILLSFFFLTGFSGMLSYQNEDIQPSLRKQIHSLNDKIILGYKEKNSSILFNLYAPENQKEKDFKNQTEQHFSKTSEFLLNREYSNFADYHVKVKSFGNSNITVATAPLSSKEGFIFNFPAKSNEIFISQIKGSGENEDALLTIVYIKINKQWRVSLYAVGTLNLGGKSPAEWASEAKSNYEKGYYLTSMLKLMNTGRIMNMAPFIKYKEESKWMELVKKINQVDKKQFQFPFEISEMNDKPLVFSITLKKLYDPDQPDIKWVPLIKYKTNLSKNDIDLIKKENKSMLPFLTKKYSGLTHEANSVLFEAFFELPKNPNKNYPVLKNIVKI